MAAGFSGVLFSAIFSTSGFAVSLLGAFRAPARNCENSVEEMRSTGIDSAGGAFRAFGANDTKAHSSTAACKLADMVRPVFMAIGPDQDPCSTSVTSATRWKPAAESRPMTRITVP